MRYYLLWKEQTVSFNDPLFGESREILQVLNSGDVRDIHKQFEYLMNTGRKNDIIAVFRGTEMQVTHSVTISDPKED